MTLDELRQLNYRDAGSWPLPVKAVALLLLLVAMLVAAYFLDWSAQLEELDAATQKEVQLKQEFLDKKKQAVNLELYRKQLAEIEQSFGALLKQLPNKSEMDALLTDINQAGLGRGLQFELFKPAAQENRTEYYAELPVTIKVSGTYHDLGAFTSDIAKLPRIVLLQDISIGASKDANLVMDAVAKTYRYLDEEEAAAQKKAAKDKASKERGKK
ncbi:MAG TPA: type 4a pilus biogenesis protein PilO [Burkholderiales bacterium]|jgi:type IV pilus assembly protein PilO|nr:type 4a pilus biogenesis protein PilO [Burkholderiales bacterium]